MSIKKKKEVLKKKIIEKFEVEDKPIINKKANSSQESLPFICKFPGCSLRFALSSALGGHISKSHPGQSKAYIHKKNVRERRKLERMLHKEAMDHYILSEKNPQIIE